MPQDRDDSIWLVPGPPPPRGMTRRDWGVVSAGLAGLVALLVVGPRLDQWVADGAPAAILLLKPVWMFTVVLLPVVLLGIGLAKLQERSSRPRASAGPAPLPATAELSVEVGRDAIRVWRADGSMTELPRTAAGGIEFDGDDLVVGEQRADVGHLYRHVVRAAAREQGWDVPLGGPAPEPDDVDVAERAAAGGRTERWAQPERPGKTDAVVPFTPYRELLAAASPAAVLEDRPRWHVLPSASGVASLVLGVLLLAAVVSGDETLVMGAGLFLLLPFIFAAADSRGLFWRRRPRDAVKVTVSTTAIDVAWPKGGSTFRAVAGESLEFSEGRLALYAPRRADSISLAGVDGAEFLRQARLRGWAIDLVD